jgi:hypothetical protein
MSEYLEEIRLLVDLLSIERAKDDQKRAEVGSCLCKISDDLFGCWMEFSNKVGITKIQCQENWKQFKTQLKSPILKKNMPYAENLHIWVKDDAPIKYQSYLIDYYKNKFGKSLFGCTQDIADIIYVFNQFDYCFSLSQNGSWYQFKNHRWYKLEEEPITEIINEQIVDVYRLYQSKYLNGSNNRVTKLLEKLTDEKYIKDVVKECELQFYSKSFVQTLDTNFNLIAFENGIYDLKYNQFRAGRPEDNLLKTTGINYIEFDENDLAILNIRNYLSEISLNQEVADYLLILFASFLEGNNVDEKYYIITDENGQFKNLDQKHFPILFDLFNATFGQYVKKLKMSSLTRKNIELIDLTTIRLVMVQSHDQTDHIDIDFIKELTGGDRLLYRTTDDLEDHDCDYHEAFINYKPPFKIVANYHCEPEFDVNDISVWRRIILLPFKKVKKISFSNFDLNHRSAFAYLLLKNYQACLSQTFCAPKTIFALTKKYQENCK